MEPFRYHVYLCTQEKPDNALCCATRGSQAVLEALRAELGKAGLGDEVQVTTSGSVGLCERGPNMVVYPDGVWHAGLQVADVPEIVREHFVHGRPVALKVEILENKRQALAAMKARTTAQVCSSPGRAHNLL